MDALDLIAKIKMDISEYEDGLDKAKSSAEKSGSGISSAFGKVASGVGTAMATAAKATAVAVGAAVTGVATLTAKAVESYAEYEQLTGGIQKLYGNMGMTLEDYADYIGKTADEAREEWQSLEDAQNKVLENASNAFKTTGMTANEYINSVTGFSAALINSLEGDANQAAEVADMAMQDIADNANTFGKYTAEELTNVYQALAKGQYMTLDNLNLGYGGTKEGMQSLIDKANELAVAQGEAGDLVIDSYADIVTAIHLVQEDMNITGTTAREASKTIEGSLNQTKAAWGNLVTGIADENANLDQLTKNLIDSLVGYVDDEGNEVNGFIDNVIPVVETALSSIGTLVEKLVPEALEIIPTLITDFLPSITSAATELATGLVSSISDNMSTISDVVSQLLEAFLKLLPNIITLGGQIVSTLASAIFDNLDSILSAAGQILEMIVTGISQNAEKIASGATVLVSKLITFLAENSKLLIDGAITLIEGILTGILENLDLILEAGIQLALSVGQGLIDALPELIEHLGEFVTMITDALLEHTDEIFDAATTLFLALVEALPEITMALGDALQAVLEALINLMTGEGSSEIYESALMMFLEVAAALPQILTSLLGALWEVLNAVISALGDAGQNLFVGACEFFGKMSEGLTEVASDILTQLGDTISGWVTAVTDTVSDWADAGRQLISGIWQGFTGKFGEVYNSIKSKLQSLTSMAKSNSVFDINSPSKVWAKIGEGLSEGLEDGWDDEFNSTQKAIKDDLNSLTDSSSTIGFGSVGSAINTATIGMGTQNQHITLYATTTLDGKKVGESTYNFTVDKINGQNRAMAVMQGGYY